MTRFVCCPIGGSLAVVSIRVVPVESVVDNICVVAGEAEATAAPVAATAGLVVIMDGVACGCVSEKAKYNQV